MFTGLRSRYPRAVARGERPPESGQVVPEYALLLGGIAIACLLAALILGGRIGDLFGSTSDPVSHGPFTPPAMPASVHPLTVEECLDGGWQSFPQFESEEECTSYVNDLGP